MSDTETDPVDKTDKADNPHAQATLKLANAMQRATLVFGLGTIAVALIVFTILYGTDGLIGALIGGAVAFGSSMATLAVMRFCAGMEPMMIMAVVLGSYVVKILILLGLMTLLSGVGWLHPYALAITMLAAFMVAAGAEVRAFQKTKIPTIIPDGR
ncbi:hypothetical protein [Amycolatopsis nigrescens]|uniref:hypothetical protein n=1 Tax=Amycolatopsis nigrescens TaxID=381445 RepID=UPI00035E6817|nr:hypothetical protein [Amycolatopsis nigrescens]